ncbi:PH domain-containing protein [Bacillus pseudomycoides]|uniref:PH domain-containing protein n=1 Tax=Bacillus pseudomycoides TaxID=64104 RepID=UPI000BED8DB5|nr:PH domain-containing protein [Bacillus pseudomycoides]PEE40067.1 translation initiation factor, aIF-2BI [Bacillus pseudomycoides]PGA91352.1 translation initiation factor, aIF-2BI [Bacillus pseudomycoides]PHF37350.1 translation initiation factor, aIF-2BI [Bacillus pseudomycoides]
MNELLLNVKKYVEPDEQILSFVVGIYEKDNFFFSYQQGIFVATNRRILFYVEFGYYPAIFEEYSYLHIDEIDMYPHLVFAHKNETVGAKHIQTGNVKKFVHAIRANLNN